LPTPHLLHDGRDKLRLRLDGAALQSVEPGQYALALTLINALGQEASTIAEFVVAEAGAKPSLTINGPGGGIGGVASVVKSKPLLLHGKLQLDSVCKGSAARVVLQWSCTAEDGSACSVTGSSLVLRLQPAQLASMKYGVEYTFQLTAGFAGSTATTIASTVRIFCHALLLIQVYITLINHTRRSCAMGGDGIKMCALCSRLHCTAVTLFSSLSSSLFSPHIHHPVCA